MSISPTVEMFHFPKNVPRLTVQPETQISPNPPLRDISEIADMFNPHYAAPIAGFKKKIAHLSQGGQRLSLHR
jgi:hypothetical protein